MMPENYKTNDPIKSLVFLREICFFSTTLNKDIRGEFTRIFDFPKLKKELNIDFSPRQISYSKNPIRGTRRGLHVRTSVPLESKLVRPISGSIFDVLLDCRKDSETFGVWVGFELDSQLGQGVWIPGGVAHGIQTLEDLTYVAYAMNVEFDSSLDVAINSTDEYLGIQWPATTKLLMSDKDLNALSWVDFLGIKLLMN